MLADVAFGALIAFCIAVFTTPVGVSGGGSNPEAARSARNPRFCQNTPTIATYPRISASDTAESRAAESRLPCGIQAEAE
jgi:hypothetical protein